VNLIFYVAASVTLVATLLAITRINPVYALLNFVLSLLGMGVIFYVLGAPLAAALEVIVYAGAIMVLFLFVVMMLSLNQAAMSREKSWTTRVYWVFPVLLVVALGVELTRVLFNLHGQASANHIISPQEVGIRLFTVDVSAVELASMMLLAGLIGAFHLGRPAKRSS
jgi:NADH-quinone oxidoreductase subunit J